LIASLGETCPKLDFAVGLQQKGEVVSTVADAIHGKPMPFIRNLPG
jgi:hypothetical protein